MFATESWHAADLQQHQKGYKSFRMQKDEEQAILTHNFLSIRNRLRTVTPSLSS